MANERSRETFQQTSSNELRVLYEVSRKLTSFTDLDDVVGFATRRAREIFEADGCSLILLDRGRNEFAIPVASQRGAGVVTERALAEIRFPADQGIAGWVFKNDEAALVHDVANDDRFYGGVDHETDSQTRSLLCAPLRTGAVNIGVIEVVNPALRHLTEDRLQFLDTLGNEIALAYEKADLYRRLRAEVISLRQIGRIAGVAMSFGGFLMAAFVAMAHRARVLPWVDLFGRREMWVALVLLIGGVVVTVLTRKGPEATS